MKMCHNITQLTFCFFLGTDYTENHRVFFILSVKIRVIRAKRNR